MEIKESQGVTESQPQEPSKTDGESKKQRPKVKPRVDKIPQQPQQASKTDGELKKQRTDVKPRVDKSQQQPQQASKTDGGLQYGTIWCASI